jgi:alpha-galactosidase/6-phospho-beta-glucosidase family protein
MSIKIVVMGAGSIGFTRKLTTSISVSKHA